MNETDTAFVNELSDVSGKLLISLFLVAPVPQAVASTFDWVLKLHKMGIGPPSTVACKAKGTFRIEPIDEKFVHLWSLNDKVMPSANTATFMNTCITCDYKLKKSQTQDHVIITEYGHSPPYGSESSFWSPALMTMLVSIVVAPEVITTVFAPGIITTMVATGTIAIF